MASYDWFAKEKFCYFFFRQSKANTESSTQSNEKLNKPLISKLLDIDLANHSYHPT